MEIQQQRGQYWLKVRVFLILQQLVIWWGLWACENQQQNLSDLSDLRPEG